MKKLTFSLLSALVIMGMLPVACTQSNQQATNSTATIVSDSSGTAFKPANMKEQMIYSRAIEAANWGMSAVNFDLMVEATKKAGGNYNQITIWPGLLDWMNQTITPNPDVIYVMPFVNTEKVGPMVLEIPPADTGTVVGSIMDRWQMAMDDVGPAGLDKGKGGKYLILPPGYKEPIPAGYIPMYSDTYLSYSLLRVVLKSGDKKGIDNAVAYAKRIQLYPLSQANASSKTIWVDASGKEYNSLIPYDLDFYKSLNRAVQDDIWLTKDQAMIDPLKYIGIEKGKPFNPDARTKEILTYAIRDAKIWFKQRFDSLFDTPFYEGTNWAFPVTEEFGRGVKSNFADPNSYPTDMRGLLYTFIFFSAKHAGEGQWYLMAIKDKDNQILNGSDNYRLHVPANVPVRQYWSITVYDAAVHAFIRNFTRFNRSSQSPGLQKNADGSVDIYFGPKAPEGKEPNWIPTNPGGTFELMARFYGPDKTFFTKEWKLGNVEKVQ
ncbi:DUF1254 domain-containing protein [Mucilaginibacter jinjuensis]|uniref:DUF1254 domain-containing protein n=1 Tax=Mucilaginibacter jinjuensis TaxID=1176721 RepID=A0ABY7TBQ7_9SPHI|nr:DUF1254 domain-containing protein [Mucilaginibacter jinjuensis]WCT13092.1 DUF1254 domain-containing protein [Mucilaginibacter jinjuensis]